MKFTNSSAAHNAHFLDVKFFVGYHICIYVIVVV